MKNQIKSEIDKMESALVVRTSTIHRSRHVCISSSSNEGQMSRIEVMAFQKFCRENLYTENPIPIVTILHKEGMIEDKLFQFVLAIDKMGHTAQAIWDLVVHELANICKVQKIIETLYLYLYEELARRLFFCLFSIQIAQRGIPHIYRVNIRNNALSQYFREMKTLIHQGAFNDPYNHLEKLGKMMKEEIKKEQDRKKKMALCDKFIVHKAAQMDSLANISKSVSPTHEGFLEIKAYVDASSNPDLSSIILLGRQADALSTTGDFTRGENYMRGAFVRADTAIPCVEIADMYYKNVVFKLAEFENNPTNKAQKSVLLECHRALWSLCEEEEENQIFWRRLILLRMAFAYLGVGKHCKIVQNYHPSENSIKESEMILRNKDLKKMELRRKMFKCVAKARLYSVKYNVFDGHMESNDQSTEHLKKAIRYSNKAEKLAEEGCYAELKAIIDFKCILTENVEKLTSKQIDCGFCGKKQGDTVHEADCRPLMPDARENISTDSENDSSKTGELSLPNYQEEDERSSFDEDQFNSVHREIDDHTRNQSKFVTTSNVQDYNLTPNDSLNQQTNVENEDSVNTNSLSELEKSNASPLFEPSLKLYTNGGNNADTTSGFNLTSYFRLKTNLNKRISNSSEGGNHAPTLSSTTSDRDRNSNDSDKDMQLLGRKLTTDLQLQETKALPCTDDMCVSSSRESNDYDAEDISSISSSELFGSGTHSH